MPNDEQKVREHAGAGPAVVWKDGGVQGTYANSVHVSGTREEMVLRFGTRSTEGESSGEARIRWTDAVTLSPQAAKRFALLLDRVLARQEARFGETGPEDPGAEPAATEAPASLETLRSHSRTGRLIALVEELNAQPLFERSFKVSAGTLELNRFLLGLPKREIGAEPQKKLLHLCRQLEAPEAYLKALSGELPDSDFVHFGFEEAGGRCLYKVYLEFSTRLEKMAESDPEALRSMMQGRSPFLMFLGFKWNPEDMRDRALTKYRWYPGLPLDEMLRRASGVLEGRKRDLTYKALETLLGRVAERVRDDRVNYFDVLEEESGRRSFDVNVYDAKLRMDDVQALLLQVARGFSLSRSAFQPLMNRIGYEMLGHLSGGIDRRGRGFLTFYHGGGRLERQEPWTEDIAPGKA